MTKETTVTIDGTLREVEALLQETLTTDEIAALTVKAENVPIDPLAPERQGEAETVRIVVEFVGMAVAGGITYDIIKKVTLAAIAKFGEKRVK